MGLKKLSDDAWFMINLSLVVGAAVVTGLVLYLKEHLEWSWH